MIQAGAKGQVRWVKSLLGTSLLNFILMTEKPKLSVFLSGNYLSEKL